MGMYAQVRRLYFRERLSINEIKRQTSLSRNTIKKWIKKGEGVEPKYVRPKATSKIIHRWHDQAAKASGKSAFVPLKFQLGEAFQFNWSEEPLVIGGIRRKLLVAHTKLCASPAFWLVAYSTQSHEMLFDAHIAANEVAGTQ